MAVNFPNNPIVGQQFTVDNVTREWNGIAWMTVGVLSQGAQGFQGSQGPQGNQGFQGVATVAGLLDSQVVFANSITPSSLSSNTHNYNPTGLSTCNFLRLSATTNVSLTGLQSPSPAVNQFIMVVNLGTGNINMIRNNPASNAGNRFINNNDVLLNANECAIVMYDALSSGWRIFGIQV